MLGGWRDVFFASYLVDPETVATRLPDRLDVDTFDGDAYLSAVPSGAVISGRPDCRRQSGRPPWS
jgi:Uncharacterized conserved protein